MKRVARQDLLDWATYADRRAALRAAAMAAKQLRRVHVGDSLTFLFESFETIRYQIHEMMRAEKIVREEDIAHEIETYNELVPGPSELSATIFIEYSERDERDRMLAKLAGIDDKFWLEVAGERSFVVPDRRNERKDRTLAVHYVKFPLSPAGLEALRAERGPIRLGVDHPGYSASVELGGDALGALSEDLA